MGQNTRNLFFDTMVSMPETGCAYMYNELDSPSHKHVDFYEITLVTYGAL